MSNLFTSIRFILALLTILAIAGRPLIPPKTLVLHPSENTDESIYARVDAHGQALVGWLDKAATYLRCVNPAFASSPPCGVSFNWVKPREAGCIRQTEFTRCSSPDSDPDGDGWGLESGKQCIVILEGTRMTGLGAPFCLLTESDPDGDGWGWEDDESCLVVAQLTQTTEFPLCSAAAKTDSNGVLWENGQRCVDEAPSMAEACLYAESLMSFDATGYDGFLIKVHYEGRSPYLRLNVTVADPELLALGKTAKVMSAYLGTEDLRTGPKFVGFDEFIVQEWWTVGQNPPRKLAMPTLNYVTDVALDTFDQGVHRLRVDHIALTGERIKIETYLVIIAGIWAFYLLLEAFIRYYRLQISYRQEEQRLAGLVGDAQQLEEEKLELEHRTLTDPLTQVLNRNGLAHALQQKYGTQQIPAGTGLLLMDIDHFKTLNDTYGHDAGDDVLQDIATVITSAIRAEDIFVRWGGEEFILVVNRLPQEKLLTIAEKLRDHVARHPFLGSHRLKVTVSIGVAQSGPGEPFEMLFKRADKALYQAKVTRNTVSYAP